MTTPAPPDKVKAAQRRLRLVGDKLNDSRIDGIFDISTANGIKVIQAIAGLEPDGRWESPNWFKMLDKAAGIAKGLTPYTPSEAMVRKFALFHVGDPYLMGGDIGPNEWWVKWNKNDTADCSEFVQTAYEVGRSLDLTTWPALPRTAREQYPKTKPVAISQLKVGDLGFLLYDRPIWFGSKVHHVMLYVGGGVWVEARGRNWGIVRTTTAAVMKRPGIQLRRARP